MKNNNKEVVEIMVENIIKETVGFRASNVKVELEGNFIMIKYQITNLIEQATESRSLLLSKDSTFIVEDEKNLGLTVRSLEAAINILKAYI